MKERDYQKYLVIKLRKVFEGCIILKNDAGLLQGIPDLLILFRDRWASLEVKTSAKSLVRTNQKYYVDKLHDMSFASFIYPENEDAVFDALQRTFESDRPARIPKRE
jgi:hypothetical protein